MQLHHLVVDDFLSRYAALRAYADEADYQPLENPVDHVSYPGICTQIPTEIRVEIGGRLSAVMGASVAVHFMFMRLSLAGVPVPHQAHTDISMGPYSLMLYLNREAHCRGGTSLVRHVTGMDRNPVNAEQEALWRRDTNSPEQWTPYLLAEMRANRAFVFDASLFHRAEPIGGFGKDATDGRLVLTAFFSLE